MTLILCIHVKVLFKKEEQEKHVDSVTEGPASKTRIGSGKLTFYSYLKMQKEKKRKFFIDCTIMLLAITFVEL